MRFNGAGIYTGMVTSFYTIDKLSLKDAACKIYNGASEWNENTASFRYTANGTTPAFTVRYDGKTIDPSNYMVRYANNRAAADLGDAKKAPSITITGKGNFKDAVTVRFTIYKTDLGLLGMTVPDMVASPRPIVLTGVKADITDKGTKLKQVTDYDKNMEFTYDEDTTVKCKEGIGRAAKEVSVLRARGTAVGKGDIVPAGAVIRVTVYASAKGNYTGYTTNTFCIAEKSIRDLKFTMIPQGYDYTGKAIRPGKADIKVEKKNGAKWEPADGSVYDIVQYSNNVRKGMGKITIKGKGGYAGTTTLMFRIK
ncbi:MAG: hypothetical protein K5857_10065 [Lachnospiraceae bacterium]|nr:hypothetical protein [Lachnospiraceae bacterium]